MPFYEDIAILIILDHPVDYGLYRNRGPTSIGPDGLFVEPSLNALIRVLINLMRKADFNCNVTKYFSIEYYHGGNRVWVSGPVNLIEENLVDY